MEINLLVCFKNRSFSTCLNFLGMKIALKFAMNFHDSNLKFISQGPKLSDSNVYFEYFLLHRHFVLQCLKVNIFDIFFG